MTDIYLKPCSLSCGWRRRYIYSLDLTWGSMSTPTSPQNLLNDSLYEWFSRAFYIFSTMMSPINDGENASRFEAWNTVLLIMWLSNTYSQTNPLLYTKGNFMLCNNLCRVRSTSNLMGHIIRTWQPSSSLIRYCIWYAGVIQMLFLIKHVCLIGVWLGEDQSTNTIKKTHV